jgi:hypothetical protein
MHEGEKKCTVFWKEEDNLEDLGINGKLTLEQVSKRIGLDGMDCINLAQEKEKWWAAGSF